MVKSGYNWIRSDLALKIFRLRRYFFHSNKNIIRTYNKLIGLWTIESAIVKPICRHGFCTNTLDVYLIYQSVITIINVLFIPETKKHCFRDYFQKKISIYPMVWSASTIRIFVSTKFQPRLCILTVINYWCGI